MKTRVAIFKPYEKWYSEYYGKNFISFEWIGRYEGLLKWKSEDGSIKEMTIYDDLEDANILEINSNLITGGYINE